jgi:hypothetical protein
LPFSFPFPFSNLLESPIQQWKYDFIENMLLQFWLVAFFVHIKLGLKSFEIC